MVLLFHSRLDGRFQGQRELLNHRCLTRPDVHFHPCGLRNGVHSRSALDRSDVEGGSRVGGQIDFIQLRNSPGQRVYGIYSAKVAPTVSSRSGDRNQKPAASQPSYRRMLDVGSVQHQHTLHMLGKLPLSKQVPHAAQVSFPFFTHIGHKQERKVRLDPAVLNSGGGSQQSCQACSVVGDARRAKAAILPLDHDRHAGRRYRVQMSGDGNQSAARAGPLPQQVAR